MTKVSVIIPTRNRAAMLRTAIESVLAQHHQGIEQGIEFETIVINDGSTDNTLDMLQHMPVRVIQGTGQGVSAARNLGLQAASGEFIAFLDDDDVWNTGYPHTQLAFLQQHPEFGAVISQIMMADEALRPNLGPLPDHDLPSGWIFEELLRYIPVVASTLVRASVARQIGGFDPSLHGGEDWDWSLRIAKQCQIKFMPEVAMFLRQHTQTRTIAKTQYEGDVAWRRYLDTMRVFHRHTRTLSLSRRISLQRRFWSLRGWFVPVFMQMTRMYMQKKNVLQAAKSVVRAIQISPIHTLVFCYRSLKRAGT